jgi:hypothetical protein
MLRRCGNTSSSLGLIELQFQIVLLALAFWQPMIGNLKDFPSILIKTNRVDI